MLSKPKGCQGCPLVNIGAGFSRPEGTGTLGVLVVGEALGAAEAQAGLPFRPFAQAGAVLERCINRAGFSREQFALWNLVACRPPNNFLDGAPYETAAVNHCATHFSGVIDRFRPRCILALGGVPLRHLTGMAGRKRTISLLRGFSIPSGGHAGTRGIPVVASYHPSFIARGATKLLGVLIRDIQFAVQVAAGGVNVETQSELTEGYVLYPTIEDARRYLARTLANASVPVSYDIETDYSLREPDESDITGHGNITQIQFSLGPGDAIVFPWQGEYIPVAKQILESPSPKWGWNNWGFDDKVLGAYGISIQGANHDLMRAWGHLQPDLPRGLQYVTSFYAPTLPPWKHLADSEAQWYGALDVDAPQRIGQRIFSDLDAGGIRRGYDRHVFGLYPILRRMCERGLPVDRARRDSFRAEVEAARKKIGGEIQELVPAELLQRHPADGYKVNPPPLRALALELGIKFKPKQLRVYSDEFKRRSRELGFQWFAALDGTERFYVEKPFLATSTEQVLAYIRMKGHRVPLGLKTRKETTEKKELVRLAQRTGDEFYLKIIEYRELLKVVSTYIDGWVIDENNRVHSTVLPGPATGQLASRDPNIQNIPKAGGLADGFRRIIRAPKSHKLLEFDYTAFHALTTGFEARDPDYMRLARLDIHSYLAGHLLRLEGRDDWLQLSTEDLRRTLADIKKRFGAVRNKKAKPAILGYGFGLGAKKLYDMNIESFSSRKEAQGVIDMLNNLFPRTAAWRESVKDQAARQRLLRSSHGYIRRFYDVYHNREVSTTYEPQYGDRLFTCSGRTFKRVTGEEGEDAIAFLPANDAFGHIKDVMLSLETRGLNERFGLINTIHDSLLFECPDELVDECLVSVAEIMEAPSEVLTDSEVAPEGLRCGIEASVGENWASQSKVNPEGMRSVYVTPIERIL